MTREEITEVLSRYVAGLEALDVDAMMPLHLDTCTFEGPASGRLKGKPAIEGFYRAWIAAFPDMQLDESHRLQDGHRAVLIWKFTASHRGQLFGVTGTGKRVSADVLAAIRFEGTGIAGLRFFYDFGATLLKTGALKVKPV